MWDSTYELSSTIKIRIDADVQTYATQDGRVSSFTGQDPRITMEIRSIPKPVFDRVVQFLKPIFPELEQVQTVVTGESPQGRTLQTATAIRQREEELLRLKKQEYLNSQRAQDVLETADAPTRYKASMDTMRRLLRWGIQVCGKQPIVDLMRQFIPPDKQTNLKYISLSDYDAVAERIWDLLEAEGVDRDRAGPTSFGATVEDVKRYMAKRGEDSFSVPGELPIDNEAARRLVVDAGPQIRELDLDDDY